MIILNNKIVEFGEFPNKESNLDIFHENDPECNWKVRSYNKIDWMYESEREIVQLGILKEYLDSQLTLVSLGIHYMPHSRMDRRNGDYAFSLNAVSKLIKSMDFDKIVVIEPHSDVTPALLGAYAQSWCMPRIEGIVDLCGAMSLFYPDAGAQKKYFADYDYAVGIKNRDFKTGKILSFDCFGRIENTVLIVDDMCSRGGTFKHSAMLLRSKGAMEIYAMAAYCENSVFDGDLFDHIDGLYISKQNVMNKEHDKLILI